MAASKVHCKQLDGMQSAGRNSHLSVVMHTLGSGAVRELWEQTGGRASMEGELAALRQRLREEEAAVQTRDTQLAHLTETVRERMSDYICTFCLG